MTKRDLCEIGIKLIGMYCLVMFFERLPNLINVRFQAGDLYMRDGMSVMIELPLFFLLAMFFLIRGAAIAGHLVGDNNVNGELSQSSINSQDLLSVALKVLGLFWMISFISHINIPRLVIGCILVFGTRQIVDLINDNNLTKAISQLGKTIKPKDVSPDHGNRSIPVSSEANPSTINSQNLLFVAVKVLGLYWVFNAFSEMRFILFVIGCILVFATRHVVVLISDNNLAKAISQLGKALNTNEGSSSNSESSIHHPNAPEIPANKNQVKVEEAKLDTTKICAPEQAHHDASEDKIGDNRKKTGIFTEIFGKPEQAQYHSSGDKK